MHGKVWRQGKGASHGEEARRGDKANQGKGGKAMQGKARHVKAKQGRANQGKTRQGKARRNPAIQILGPTLQFIQGRKKIIYLYLLDLDSIKKVLELTVEL